MGDGCTFSDSLSWKHWVVHAISAVSAVCNKKSAVKCLWVLFHLHKAGCSWCEVGVNIRCDGRKGVNVPKVIRPAVLMEYTGPLITD